MTIRPYISSDKERCREIFFSNCPKFFHPDEIKGLENWLSFQDIAEDKRIPAYSNSKKDYFFVLEKDNRVIGYAGFYLYKDENRAHLTWGVVDAMYHGKGCGKILFNYRVQRARELDPDKKITLGTSQNTYKYFEKFGMKVNAITPNGYGYGFDKYDMSLPF